VAESSPKIIIYFPDRKLVLRDTPKLRKELAGLWDRKPFFVETDFEHWYFINPTMVMYAEFYGSGIDGV
jgi:hypothetical protein